MPPLAAILLLGLATPSAAARETLDREALQALQASQPPDRDWHWAKWLNGPGRVGRLHDYCTGAVEPQPDLSIGRWRWTSLDPRKLSADDRQRVVAWRVQQWAAQFACGSTFEIGDLGFKARQRFAVCKVDPVEAFTDYVSRNPQLRPREDDVEVTVEALRDAGCH